MSEGHTRAASGQSLTAGVARHVLYSLSEGAHTPQLPVVVINNAVVDRDLLWCSCIQFDIGHVCHQPLAGHACGAELANSSTLLYGNA